MALRHGGGGVGICVSFSLVSVPCHVLINLSVCLSIISIIIVSVSSCGVRLVSLVGVDVILLYFCFICAPNRYFYRPPDAHTLSSSVDGCCKWKQ